MNPRVSRSSALASKATGFPIAKIAALLAVGYRLDEITNDITGETPVSFEPTLDYVVVKIPRFAFEKFPEADPRLTSTMKSVGEVMAIGRTFKEALGKAWRGIEKTGFDLGSSLADVETEPAGGARAPAPRTGCTRWRRALEAGRTVDEVAAASAHRPVVRRPDRRDRGRGRRRCVAEPLSTLDAPAICWRAKRLGLSDARLAMLTGATEAAVRRHRDALGVAPVFKTVDTCGGEFPARTPYHYSTYEEEIRGRARRRDPRVVILGAGPNRIGQGIEFDYACVHAAFALEEAGFESVMVNSNPETVSTDYDTSSRLYFEPLSPEDVLAVCRAEQPVGVIAQLGGQTPLRLARMLQDEGFAMLGHVARRDRPRRGPREVRRVLAELEIPAPPHGEARTIGRGPRDRRADRLSRRGPALVRARRASDGDRVRRRRARDVRADRVRRLARPPGADRPVPGRRDRGRRRRGGRRLRRRVHRRGHGAHRGSGRALGRLLLPDPAGDAVRRGARRDRGHHPPARPPARGRGAAQPAARREGRAHLGDRGEPASLAHRAVRLEGDRRLARQHRHAGAAGPHARSTSAPTGCCRPIRTTTGTCRTRA